MSASIGKLTVLDRQELILQDINEYSAQRKISLSLYAHLRAIGKGNLEIEPVIERAAMQNQLAVPDLLFRQNGDVIIDIKSITSNNQNTYRGRVQELQKYDEKFRLRGEVFKAELVACCPKKIVEAFEPPENYCIIGYDFDDSDIIFGPLKNTIKNTGFTSLLSGGFLRIPVRYGTEKFLRREPQLAYLAEQVYNSIFAASDTDFQKPFVRVVELNALKQHLRSAYPFYLRAINGDPIPQIADGRLEKALVFLERHGWIRRRSSDTIELFTAKGSRTGDPLTAFIKIQAEEQDREAERQEKARREQEVKTASKLGPLNGYFSKM